MFIILIHHEQNSISRNYGHVIRATWYVVFIFWSIKFFYRKKQNSGMLCSRKNSTPPATVDTGKCIFQVSFWFPNYENIRSYAAFRQRTFWLPLTPASWYMGYIQLFRPASLYLKDEKVRKTKSSCPFQHFWRQRRPQRSWIACGLQTVYQLIIPRSDSFVPKRWQKYL